MAVVAAIILVVTLTAMTSGRVEPVLALITALVAAGLIGIASPSELFAGLANGGVITVAAMLVIAKGVLRTGVVSRLTGRLLDGARTSRQALTRLIPPVGVMSALINTTPIVAMLIPATKELEQRSAIPARRVLLPIAHATTLAGSATLIGTSSNLLIAGLASPAGVDISMFSFMPVAAPVAIVGWLVLLATARMLGGSSKPTSKDLSWRAEIPVTAHAGAIGRRAAEAGIDSTTDYLLTEIVRDGESLTPDTVIADDDVLVYRATEDGVRMPWNSPRFRLAPQRLYLVSVATNEQKSLRDMERDGAGGMLVVAAETSRPLVDARAEPGGLCLVTAKSSEVLEDRSLVALWQELPGKSPQAGKTWIALAILAGVIGVGTAGLAPVELAAAAGATLMVLTGVLTPRSAVRALNWNILAIIAGSIGLGVIVDRSGLGRYISDAVLYLAGDSTILVMLVIALATTLLTNAVTNAAAAAILTPVALTIAAATQINPVLLLTVVGTCISFTFINPYSHQSNLMVMRPGGYSTGQFVRYGIPLTITSVITVVAVGWGWSTVW